jgi:serine/threonine-protein kinase
VDLKQLGELELLKRLGAGAQAEVFLAVDRDGELVAVKVMLEHLTVKEEARKAFMREARTSTLLKHPNIVETYDVAEADGRPYLSMELVRGPTVSQLLKKMRAAGGERLDPDEAAELVRQAALGLHFAHEVKGPGGTPLGLVHRDVSPQNIMIGEDGVAKVLDFGLAKATLAPETVTTTLKGKLRYMPPEQLKSQPIDRRADVFALGAVLWELACGTPLHPGASEAEVFQQALYQDPPHPDEVSKGLSRQMVDVLVKATERSADKRTATAAQLAEALASLSSRDAREKLAARVKKHFEPLPHTADEARGLEPSVTGPALPARPAKAKPKSGVVLPPPSKRPKPPSYIGPSEPDALPPPPVPDELPAAARSGPTPDFDFRERRTDQISQPIEVEKITEASGVPPLLEADTQAMSGVNPALQTIDESDMEPTRSQVAPPSRRVVTIVIAASIGMVALGALIGVAVRRAHSSDDVLPDQPDPVAENKTPRDDPAPAAAAGDDDGSNPAPVPTRPAPAPKARTAQRAEAERLFQEAQLPFAAGSFTVAKGKLDRCVKIDRTFPECHKLLGTTLGLLGDHNGESKQYEAFLKLVPAADPEAAKVRALLEQNRQR